MTSEDCLKFSKNSLNNAKGHLRSGTCLDLVSQKLESALHWAMDGWLLANGHTNCGPSWRDKEMAFSEVGPVEIRSEFRTCLSAAIFLEMDLLGGFDDSWPPLPMDQWKIKAAECLEKTEQVIYLLLADLSRE